ncbi:MAG: hypothetical protein M3P40_08700 [Actinomycetota bacterium]|nr:hypothetical protein [Actinomycetota bacterium]
MPSILSLPRFLLTCWWRLGHRGMGATLTFAVVEGFGVGNLTYSPP